MKFLKSVKFYYWAGILFVLTVGTLAHFFYEWSGNNPLVGLFSPVNESTWEHMKLLFFPMTLYSVFPAPERQFPVAKQRVACDSFAPERLCPIQQKNCPCLPSALYAGILAGTGLIPVLFYTYSGILGYNLLVLDIGTFVISVLFAFYIGYRLRNSCRIQRYALLLRVVMYIVFICFLIFTYRAPDIGLFYAFQTDFKTAPSLGVVPYSSTPTR